MRFFNQECVIFIFSGRRSCVGEVLAKRQMLLILTTIIQHYEIHLPIESIPSLDKMKNELSDVSCAPEFEVVPRAIGNEKCET